MDIAIITQPYSGLGRGRGGGSGPATLLAGGLAEAIAAQGHLVRPVAEVSLGAEEEDRYGAWRLVATANHHLADLVAGIRAGTALAATEAGPGDRTFILGLLADCNSLLGMLGGLTRTAEPEWPRRVGLIWIDAHGDYNTPETSPSGMLGGMPVAIASGKCLAGLREESGLRVPLQAPDVVMVGLRDLDEEETAAIRTDGIVTLGIEDLLEGSERLGWALGHLAAREDEIYVHVDLDILDPGLAPAAGLPCRGGVSGERLGEGLGRLLAHPKVRALALVSYNAERDADGRTLAEVTRAILRATAGLGR